MMTREQLAKELERIRELFCDETCTNISKRHEKTVYDICLRLLVKFTEGKDEVYKRDLDLFAKVSPKFHREYIREYYITESEFLARKYKSTLRNERKLVARLETQMVHLYANGEWFPLPIRVVDSWPHNEWLGLFNGNVDEDVKFKLFKRYFFKEHVQLTTMCSRKMRYFINECSWELLNKTVPTMVQMLFDESKEYYTEEGYFDAKEKLAANEEDFNEEVSKLLEGKAETIKAIDIEGKMIGVNLSGYN